MASGELSALPSRMIVPAVSITQMLVVFTDTSKPTKNSIALSLIRGLDRWSLRHVSHRRIATRDASPMAQPFSCVRTQKWAPQELPRKPVSASRHTLRHERLSLRSQPAIRPRPSGSSPRLCDQQPLCFGFLQASGVFRTGRTGRRDKARRRRADYEQREKSKNAHDDPFPQVSRKLGPSL
jgi:hypothetical protein